MNQLELICLAELARTEAILKAAANSTKKFHEPTLEFHRGVAATCQKVLAYIDSTIKSVYDIVDVINWYVSARSDEWDCTAYKPEGCHWDKAILRKNGYLAIIDLELGHITIWSPQQKRIQPSFPYDNRWCV
jgi:hypothetical protein